MESRVRGTKPAWSRWRSLPRCPNGEGGGARRVIEYVVPESSQRGSHRAAAAYRVATGGIESVCWRVAVLKQSSKAAAIA